MGKHEVIGFDINDRRINELKENYDRTNEVTTEDLKETNINFTSKSEDLKAADFIIVAVPTPIDKNNKPDSNTIAKSKWDSR